MPQPHERLNEAMQDRRLALRMNWRQVADAAGISYEALRAIRRGDYKPTALTSRGLDDALQWAHGSVLAVLDGGDPTPAAPAATEANTLSEELELARRLLGATVRELGLSPSEAEEAWQQVRQDITRSHTEVPDPAQTGRRNRAG